MKVKRGNSNNNNNERHTPVDSSNYFSFEERYNTSGNKVTSHMKSLESAD
jgi:hypothetical protein